MFTDRDIKRILDKAINFLKSVMDCSTPIFKDVLKPIMTNAIMHLSKYKECFAYKMLRDRRRESGKDTEKAKNFKKLLFKDLCIFQS